MKPTRREFLKQTGLMAGTTPFGLAPAVHAAGANEKFVIGIGDDEAAHSIRHSYREGHWAVPKGV